METKQKPIEVGPVADNLLRALRAFEDAKNYYFIALVELMGEDKANNVMLEETPTFQPMGELIERRIRVQITDWSIRAPHENTI